MRTIQRVKQLMRQVGLLPMARGGVASSVCNYRVGEQPSPAFYPTLNPWRGELPLIYHERMELNRLELAAALRPHAAQQAAQATQPPAPPHTPTPAPTRAPAPDGAISDSEGGHHD